MFEITELKSKTIAELQKVAKEIGLKKTSQLKKLDLVYQILDAQAANPIEQKSEGSKSAKPADDPRADRRPMVGPDGSSARRSVLASRGEVVRPTCGMSRHQRPSGTETAACL